MPPESVNLVNDLGVCAVLIQFPELIRNLLRHVFFGAANGIADLNRAKEYPLGLTDRVKGHHHSPQSGLIHGEREIIGAGIHGQPTAGNQDSPLLLAEFLTQHLPDAGSPTSMEIMLDSLGKEIDCFVGPCDSLTWRERYNILPLEPVHCCIAVPRKHKMSKKKILRWSDLDGETIMLVKRGDSPVLNKMRDEIEAKHPQITLFDTPHFYDTSVFNECEQMGCVMETLDIWKDVHPSLVTIPVEWEYTMPYGIVYAKNPSHAMQNLIQMIQGYADSKKGESH